MGRVRPSSDQSHGPSKCLIYTLFFLNVLFWLIGVILIAAGSYVAVEIKEYYKDLADLKFQPAILILCVGVFIFVITFIGCIGALRQNTTLLCIYIGIISMMLILMIASAALGFFFKDKVEEKVKEKLKHAITHYRDPKRLDLQNLIDGVQTELECCGVDTVDDWDGNIYFDCKGKVATEKCGVPYSCCKKEEQINRQCGYGMRLPTVNTTARAEKIYTKGCLKQANVWLSDNLILIGGISVGVVILQLFSIGMANSLRYQIKEIRD